MKQLNRILLSILMSVPAWATDVTYLREIKASGTHGGDCIAGAWIPRSLNQIQTFSDNDSGNGSVVLEANQFTFGPGVFDVNILAPACKVDHHRIRLYNVTDQQVALDGSSEFAGSQNEGTSYSGAYGLLIVNHPTTFEVQHQCSTTQETIGLGMAAGFDETIPEIYTQIRIEKE